MQKYNAEELVAEKLAEEFDGFEGFKTRKADGFIVFDRDDVKLLLAFNGSFKVSGLDKSQWMKSTEALEYVEMLRVAAYISKSFNKRFSEIMEGIKNL